MRSEALSLDVLVNKALVGRLDRNRHGAVRFRPDPSWLEGGQRPRLGYAFFVDPRVRVEGARLPSWFENLLPERGTPLRSRVCREAGLRDNQSAALLEHLGADLPGAIVVAGARDLVDDDEGAPADGLRVSLAGVQLKLSMVRSGDRYVLPAKGASGRWIVKLPGMDLPELPQIEAATMAWAARSGLPVPPFEVVALDTLAGVPADWNVGGHEVYAIERFDRKPDGGRVHQEDLCQVLEFPPDLKYADDPRGGRRTSFDRLGRLIRDVCGAGEVEGYVRRLAFTVASGDTDAHLKNWSVVWGDEGKARLSPLYDQVSCVSLSGHGWQTGSPTLALPFGRRQHLADLTRQAVWQFAHRSNIESAEDLFFDALSTYRDTFRQGSVPDQMRTALVEHWQRVPILQGLGGLPA